MRDRGHARRLTLRSDESDRLCTDVQNHGVHQLTVVTTTRLVQNLVEIKHLKTFRCDLYQVPLRSQCHYESDWLPR